MSDDLDLLRAGLHLHWVRDHRGRIVRANTPEHRAAPALVVDTTVDGTGRVWAASVDVPDDIVERIDDLLHADAAEERILALLGPRVSVEIGTSYVLDRPPPERTVPPGSSLHTSEQPAAEAVRALVPDADRSLAAPWAIALVDGEVAAVCESARLRPTAAAAGVWTYEPYRRRGLATAVVATWARLVDGTPHYGHERANRGSAGVARNVGFRPIGSWWWVRFPATSETQT